MRVELAPAEPHRGAPWSRIDVGTRRRNATYYGKAVTPTDIALNAKVRNPQAERMASDLERASMRQRTSSAR